MGFLPSLLFILLLIQLKTYMYSLYNVGLIPYAVEEPRCKCSCCKKLYENFVSYQLQYWQLQSRNCAWCYPYQCVVKGAPRCEARRGGRPVPTTSRDNSFGRGVAQAERQRRTNRHSGERLFKFCAKKGASSFLTYPTRPDP